jgi:hypothetical protein
MAWRRRLFHKKVPAMALKGGKKGEERGPNRLEDDVEPPFRLLTDCES